MKKALAILIIISQCLTLSACSSSSSTNTSSNQNSTSSTEATFEQKGDDINSGAEQSAEFDLYSEMERTDSVQSVVDKEESIIDEIGVSTSSFVNGEIYNDNGVTITAEKIEYSDTNTNFSFVLENTSEQEYTLYSYAFSVNGFMSLNAFYNNRTIVSSGSKARMVCTVENKWLKDIGATSINSFDILFWAYGEDSKLSWKSDMISVPIENATETSGPQAEMVYEDEYVSVSILRTEPNSVTYCVWNHSGYLAELEAKDCSIDGWTYDMGSSQLDLNDEPIFNGHSILLNLVIDDAFLQENGIESPSTASIKFGFTDKGNELVGDIWQHTTGDITVNLT